MPRINVNEIYVPASVGDALSHSGESMDSTEFTRLVKWALGECSIRHFADLVGVNPGVVWRVANGGDSPALRRAMNIRKTNRCRLGLDVTEELRAEFHRRRGDMTGGEYLAMLMEECE